MWDELESLFIYMAWLRLKDMWTLSNDNNQANLIARCPFPTRLAKPFCTLNFKDGKLTRLPPPPKTNKISHKNLEKELFGKGATSLERWFLQSKNI